MMGGAFLICLIFVGISVCMALLASHVRSQDISVWGRYRLNPRTAWTRRQTCIQALLYVGAYFGTHIFIFIDQLVGTPDQTIRFFLAIMLKFTVPLQGFFNCAIYIRPRYIVLRAQQQGETAPSCFCLLWRLITSGRDHNGEHGAGADEQIDGFAPELNERNSSAIRARSMYRSSFFETGRGQSVVSSSQETSNRPSSQPPRTTNSVVSDETCSSDNQGNAEILTTRRSTRSHARW
jgi:hypothetical protein